MRIKMSGAYSLNDFEEAVDCITQVLEQNGVDEVRAVSIYFTPFSALSEVHFEDQVCGAPFQILRYMGHRRRQYKYTSPRLLPEAEFEQGFGRNVIYVQPHDLPTGRIDQFIGMLGKKLQNKGGKGPLNGSSS